MHLGVAFALKAFEAGTSGHVTKSAEPGELVRAVKVVAGGGRFLSEDMSPSLQIVSADRTVSSSN